MKTQKILISLWLCQSPCIGLYFTFTVFAFALTKGSLHWKVPLFLMLQLRAVGTHCEFWASFQLFCSEQSEHHPSKWRVLFGLYHHVSPELCTPAAAALLSPCFRDRALSRRMPGCCLFMWPSEASKIGQAFMNSMYKLFYCCISFNPTLAWWSVSSVFFLSLSFLKTTFCFVWSCMQYLYSSWTTC